MRARRGFAVAVLLLAFALGLGAGLGSADAGPATCPLIACGDDTPLSYLGPCELTDPFTKETTWCAKYQVPAGGVCHADCR